MEKQHRILLVTFPAQGHINPSLQFAKRLVKMGVEVTFLTAFSALNRMNKANTPQGLTMVGFSDGYDDGRKLNDDYDRYMSDLERHNSKAVADLLSFSTAEGKPFIRVVYTGFLPWVGRVARTFHTPSTFLWIQPATILDIYFYYFNGYSDIISNSANDPFSSINLPGLPLLISRDLPSFLLHSNSYNFAIPIFKEHFKILEEEEENPKILVNSFDDLEPEALRAIKKFNLIAIGPLIPSAFLDGNDPSDTSFGGDLIQNSGGYNEWLDSRPKKSVIYVAFGSYSELSKRQMEEIARALLETHRPFLWIIRPPRNQVKEEGELSCKEELEQHGMIVPWCSQVEVLSHQSLGCFVTHCGWNSSLESLVSSVPVVAFPLWTDQGTNAKLIEDVWKTGVRVTPNEEGIVESHEIKRCLEVVMGCGERREEMRMNAKKWSDLAREATKEGGSSDLNLKTFVASM
ncbi:Hexosyltransferase [Sarracenia purpurea var. burkii]